MFHISQKSDYKTKNQNTEIKSEQLPYVSMKSYSIVKAAITESDKVLTRPGSDITVQLNVQITMCCMQLHISFLLWVLLNFDIFIFIFSDRIKRSRSEGS